MLTTPGLAHSEVIYLTVKRACGTCASATLGRPLPIVLNGLRFVESIPVTLGRPSAPQSSCPRFARLLCLGTYASSRFANPSLSNDSAPPLCRLPQSCLRSYMKIGKSLQRVAHTLNRPRRSRRHSWWHIRPVIHKVLGEVRSLSMARKFVERAIIVAFRNCAREDLERVFCAAGPVGFSN